MDRRGFLRSGQRQNGRQGILCSPECKYYSFFLNSGILAICEFFLERVGRVCQNEGGEIHGSGKWKQTLRSGNSDECNLADLSKSCVRREFLPPLRVKREAPSLPLPSLFLSYAEESDPRLLDASSKFSI